jgi:hypothetical protein
MMQMQSSRFLISLLLAIPFAALAQTSPTSQPSAPPSPIAQTQVSPSLIAQAPADAGPSCSARSMLFSFEDSHDGAPVRDVPIWHLGDDSAFFFTAGMAIDADGAPNAYDPQNTGLDDVSNAGSPGHWDGVLEDSDGNPLLQGPGDPFPGYYISCTALADRSKPRLDPTRFVDASKIPYIVLPGDVARDAGARLGDFAVVFNLRSGAFTYAIFADIGTLGEGSIALADNLGIWSDARQGGRSRGILYLVFPGSGNHQPRTPEEITAEASQLFRQWGGTERANSCARDIAPPSPYWSHPAQ